MGMHPSNIAGGVAAVNTTMAMAATTRLGTMANHNRHLNYQTTSQHHNQQILAGLGNGIAAYGCDWQVFLAWSLQPLPWLSSQLHLLLQYSMGAFPFPVLLLQVLPLAPIPSRCSKNWFVRYCGKLRESTSIWLVICKFYIVRRYDAKDLRNKKK